MPLVTSLFLVLLLLTPTIRADPTPRPPNILYILCDDLGYGDVHAFNPTRSKIPTPNFDRLASQSLCFTDAHSASAVCTPSRYGILTGRYAWRTRLQSGVLQGNSPPLIATTRPTVATFLKSQGYTTAIIGKWHLGLRFGPHQFTDPLPDGPLQHGFDSFFGIAASLDMPPFAFIDNDHFPQPPAVEKKWVRTGPAAKDFEAIDVLPALAQHAADFIKEQGTAQKQQGGKPFFLYLAFTSPHTPILPTAEWQNKSHLGPYGDFVMATDHATGQVLDALDAAGLADDTLVIFTSDNGCSPAAKPADLEAQGHYPSAFLRGYKADIWDGGHRIPFIVRWPHHLTPNIHTDALLSQTDFFATCVEILKAKLPANSAEDSLSMLPLLTGGRPTRDSVIHHSINGAFAIRQGNWKLELCPGSGGWGAPRDPEALKQNLPPDQLYDLAADPAEQHNLALAHPEIVARLTTLLQHTIDAAPNDAPIQLRKRPATRAAE